MPVAYNIIGINTGRSGILSRVRMLAAFLLMLCLSLPVSSAFSDFLFSDDRFRNDLSTENLDAIIEAYELYDGWYWTTQADVSQDFHGHPDSPGWTTSAVAAGRKSYLKGWYGCRWPIDHVRRYAPGAGGYAECFGFANFIGYLLSGEINPQHNWKFYYSVKASGPLQVGDMVRVEYRKNRRSIYHSAVVYAVNGDELLFLQVSGGNYNRISVGLGFTDGVVVDARSIYEISAIPGLKISRFILPE